MIRKNSPIDLGGLCRLLGILLGVMVLMILTGGAGFVIVVPFAFMALVNRKKPERMLFALLLVIAAVVANAKVMPKDIVFAMTQRALMLIVAIIMTVQIAGSASSKTIKPILLFLVYIVYMIIPSALGWSPIISFLKIILFMSVFLAFYGAASRVKTLNITSEKAMRTVVLSFVMFFMVGSLVLIPFPGISQMHPGEFMEAASAAEVTSLFKGMTMHSQCMGPCAAICGVFVVADWVFSIRRFDWLYLFLTLLCPYLIFKTSSRTAMGAYVAGCCFVFFFFIQARGIGSRWRRKVLSVALISMAALSTIALAIPSFQQGASKFILKGKDDALTMDAITSSRQGLNERAMYNFRKKPAIGNGFQVGDDMVSDNRKSLKDYLSAPIEKGFWGSAVLEEGGVFGFSIFVLCLLGIFVGLIKNKAYVGASCFFVLFISNFGEFMMFSMSYTGGFLWAVTFGGLAIDVVRNKMLQRSGGEFYIRQGSHL